MPTNVGPGLETRGRRRQADASAPVTEEQLISGLHVWLQTEDVLEMSIGRSVAMLRCFGRSWHFVGGVTGMTAEGARRRFQDVCDDFGVPRRITAEMVPTLTANLPPAAVALQLGGMTT